LARQTSESLAGSEDISLKTCGAPASGNIIPQCIIAVNCLLPVRAAAAAAAARYLDVVSRAASIAGSSNDDFVLTFLIMENL